MARENKCFKLMTMAEFKKGDDGIAVSVTYAKDKRGAKISFECGKHCGRFMMVWDGGKCEVSL